MNKKYLYNVNFQSYDDTLCAIEHRALFHEPFSEKIYFSDIAVNPSLSPFIKNRLEIITKVKTFDDLLAFVEADDSVVLDYKIKYLKLVSGDPYAADRKRYCKAVGMLFKEYVNFDNPKIVYGISHYQGAWYFGILTENNKGWLEHNNRPHTYSNSLKQNMARVLVNLVTEGHSNKSIIDPCCGAGTVLLEACFAGNPVTGSDINQKMAFSAEKNLKHFGYMADVSQKAIGDVEGHYDCAIVDLPYGHFSYTTVEIQDDIMLNAKRIADRVVIVSAEDIEAKLLGMGFKLIDHCIYRKSVNKSFLRYLWLCEIDN